MAKIIKKLTPIDHAVEVLKKVLAKQFIHSDEINKIIRNFRSGMQSKAARAKDRKYTSKEKYEQAYSKKRKSPIVKYKSKK